MIKNINITVVGTREIFPLEVREEINRAIKSKKFRNNFEIIEYVPCGNLVGRFLCVYGGYFFTVPIDHVKKL